MKVKPNVSLVKKLSPFLKNKFNNLNFTKNPCLHLFLIEDEKIIKAYNDDLLVQLNIKIHLKYKHF